MSCPRLENYLKRISAKSAAVVFSSYYMGNPASSFGHTFLRLGKYIAQDNLDDVSLLDTGVSYGAMTEGADAFSYFVGGLGGWFHGNVTAIPYYYKVREYNDFEMRDLWNYQLKLNQEQIDLLVAHSWELESAHFRYYFLSENCSIVILRMVEAVIPEINLEDDLPFYTIPSDTLKILIKKDIVKYLHYRPSAWADFERHYKGLQNKEKNELFSILKDPQFTMTSTPEKQISALDTAIRYIDYTHAKQLLKEDPEALALKRPYLIRRSQIPIQSPILKYSDEHEKAPHVGHGSRRLSFGIVKKDNQIRLQGDFRFAFHDLLDPSGGYLEYSSMEVGKISIEQNDRNNLSLKNFTLFKAMSLRPITRFQSPLSWNLGLGFDRFHSKETLNWKTFGLDTSLGWTFELAKETLSFSLMGNAQSLYSFENKKQFIFAYGPQAILFFHWNKNLKAILTGTRHLYPWFDQSIQSTLRWSTSNFAIDGLLETHSGEFKNRVGTKFHYFF